MKRTPARGAGAAGGDTGLGSLQQQSVALGRVALLGSAEHRRAPAAGPPLLLRQVELLKQQKFALENKIRAGDIAIEDLSPENLTKEHMTEIIAALEKDIAELKVAHHNKALVLRRLQLYDAIHKKLLENDGESKLIYETMQHSMGLCHRILKSQKETLALDEKLIEVRQKRMELKETCTEVMAELRALTESENNKFHQMDNLSLRKINEYIATEVDIVTVVQNVFQRLILGSRVNWAEDPKLKETVLKLGQNPDSF